MAEPIRIGTSGWQYKHWKGTFYPAELQHAKHFSYYAEHFDTVELNNPFYRLPAIATFEQWQKNSPKDFLFAVKANRFITHMKKLKDPEESTADFFERIPLLKKKLGPVLFQLPPSWKLNAERLETFLSFLPKDFRYTFEFRNTSWYTDEVYELLKKYKCAFCIYELDKHLSPLEVTTDFVYIRLHGPGARYHGRYSQAVLKKWAKRITDWSEEKKVFIYFDNDEKGYAAFNALGLKKIIY